MALSSTIYIMQMKQLLKEWRRFLKEEYEVTVNPSDYESYAEFRKDFEIAAKNKSFIEVFLDALVRLELRPLMRSLSEEDRKILFKNIKMNPTIPNFDLINNVISPQISADSALTKAGLKNDTYVLFDYLSYYVSYFTNPKRKEKFEQSIKKSPILAATLYWELFKKFPEEVPTISKIYKADTSTQNRRENLRTLEQKRIRITPEQVEKPNILDDIKIMKEIGKGAFGRVFELEDGRALKIFSSGVDFNKDIERYEKVMDQLYKGQASMEDMHIFDYGKLGESDYYFAVMPKIIPMTAADFYNQNGIFYSIAKANKDVAQRGTADSYERFKALSLASASNIYVSAKDQFGNPTLSFQQAYNKYSDMVDKIIQAGWRAYNEYGGTDIHHGNIGFFSQKPDQFFYFDM